MKLVEKMMAGMIRIDQFGKFAAQRIDLFVIESANPGQIAVGAKEIELSVGETILIPIFRSRRQFEEASDGLVLS